MGLIYHGFLDIPFASFAICSSSEAKSKIVNVRNLVIESEILHSGTESFVCAYDANLCTKALHAAHGKKSFSHKKRFGYIGIRTSPIGNDAEICGLTLWQFCDAKSF